MLQLGEGAPLEKGGVIRRDELAAMVERTGDPLLIKAGKGCGRDKGDEVAAGGRAIQVERQHADDPPAAVGVRREQQVAPDIAAFYQCALDLSGRMQPQNALAVIGHGVFGAPGNNNIVAGDIKPH